MMDKKGVSQLVSWILILGFAVAMAAIITNWAIDKTKEVNFDKQNVKDLCKDVRVDITGACRTTDNQYITVRLENKGYFDSEIATIGRETGSIPESWCIDLNFSSIVGSPEKLVNYSIGGSFLNSNFNDEYNQHTLCSDLQPRPITEPVRSFTIVPWIIIDDETIPCSDKKVTISEPENFLCNCTVGGFTCPND